MASRLPDLSFGAPVIAVSRIWGWEEVKTSAGGKEIYAKLDGQRQKIIDASGQLADKFKSYAANSPASAAFQAMSAKVGKDVSSVASKVGPWVGGVVVGVAAVQFFSAIADLFTQVREPLPSIEGLALNNFNNVVDNLVPDRLPSGVNRLEADRIAEICGRLVTDPARVGGKTLDKTALLQRALGSVKSQFGQALEGIANGQYQARELRSLSIILANMDPKIWQEWVDDARDYRGAGELLNYGMPRAVARQALIYFALLADAEAAEVATFIIGKGKGLVGNGTEASPYYPPVRPDSMRQCLGIPPLFSKLGGKVFRSRATGGNLKLVVSKDAEYVRARRVCEQSPNTYHRMLASLFLPQIDAKAGRIVPFSADALRAELDYLNQFETAMGNARYRVSVDLGQLGTYSYAFPGNANACYLPGPATALLLAANSALRLTETNPKAGADTYADIKRRIAKAREIAGKTTTPEGQPTTALLNLDKPAVQAAKKTNWAGLAIGGVAIWQFAPGILSAFFRRK